MVLFRMTCYSHRYGILIHSFSVFCFHHQWAALAVSRVARVWALRKLSAAGKSHVCFAQYLEWYYSRCSKRFVARSRMNWATVFGMLSCEHSNLLVAVDLGVLSLTIIVSAYVLRLTFYNVIFDIIHSVTMQTLQ